MSTARRKTCALVLCAPGTPAFATAKKYLESELRQKHEAYAYLLDDAVTGVSDPLLQQLRVRGLRLYACGYGAQRRGLPTGHEAIFSGLGMLHDLILHTDEFRSFN